MNKIEKQFKKDFEKKIPEEGLTFNTEKLPHDNKKARAKKRNKVLIPVLIATGATAAVVVTVVGFGISTGMIQTYDSVKEIKRNVSMNDVKLAEANTFRKLNNVSYPDNEKLVKYEFSEEETLAYNNFVNQTYHSLMNTSRDDNISYCSLNFYALMNELASASSRDDITGKFDSLLSLNESQRVGFYEHMMETNSFAWKKATTQIKNAAFFSNKYDYSPDYVNKLTNLYCEAYQTDLEDSKNVDKLVEWANEAVDEPGFIDQKFLDIKDDTVLCYLSSFYFNHAWENKYLKSNNFKDDFYLANGETVKATYMHHNFYCLDCYDYGEYYSVRDYYYGRGASITYLIPKTVGQDIFELTKDVNIFKDVPANHINYNPDEDCVREIMVYLKTPKFKNKCEISFKDCLTNLSLGDLFDENINSLGNAFTNYPDGTNFYLQNTKQKNQVEFSEDGTIVKSIGMATAGKSQSAFIGTLDVNLNQPFIYIIKDINNMPIFVGHVDNPNS